MAIRASDRSEALRTGAIKQGMAPRRTRRGRVRRDGLSLPASFRVNGRTRRVWAHSIALLVADIVALSASVLVGWWALTFMWHGSHPTGSSPSRAQLVPALLTGLLIQGAYRPHVFPLLRSGLSDMRVIARAIPAGVLLALLLSTSTSPDGASAHVLDVSLLAAPALVLLPLARAVTLLLARRVSRLREPERIVVLGSGQVARKVAGRLAQSGHSTVVGMVDDDPYADDAVLGRSGDLSALCETHAVDRVVVAFSRTPAHEIVSVLQGLEDRVAISLVPRLYETLSWRTRVEDLYGVPLLRVAPRRQLAMARAAKRGIDMAGGALGVLAGAPLFAVVAIAIKVTSPGPVFFRQPRTGRNREPFLIFKFRTMHVDADQQRSELDAHNEVDGPIFKMRQDPRVTRVGEFLRRTSLDELPQLLNVLRGEMSLVGPRPFPVEEAAKIQGRASARFAVHPGLTGLWQVSGRNTLTYDDLCHLDCVYVDCWSLSWDLRILLQTPACVLRHRGVL